MAKKIKLRGKDLKALGYDQGPAIGIAIKIVQKHGKHESKDWALAMLKNVKEHPEAFIDDAIWSPLAEQFKKEEEQASLYHDLAVSPKEFPTYGAEGIAPNAIDQMYTAMKLPVTVAGALMPDAHHGYGLPIGGVLATENAVIPYGVGVDIGCRMCLSLFDLPVERLTDDSDRFKDLLKAHTRFGQSEHDRPMDDPIFEQEAFKLIPIAKRLKDRAYRQIGSSGGGNHFVEFGIVDLLDADNEFDLPIGRYLGLLSHSGSRGLGANIAREYTQIAMQQCRLPKEAKHLAWLDLNTQAGHEYWVAMNLAGDYASACHDHIHRRMANALRLTPVARVEIHHNFAWKEHLEDGTPVIVHRKGATPAGKGVLGIIPGSMPAPGLIVRGRGDFQSLQ